MTASLTGIEIVIIAVIVVLACALAAVGLYILRSMRRRRDKLLGELKSSPELIQDRAFNRIAMARREAEIVGRSGVDITRPRELIAEAQGAFDTRNYDRAYQSAQSAHEALVHARSASTPLPSAPEHAPLPGPPGGPAVPASASGAPSSASSTPASPIPKNRVESQFQLHVLEQELGEARAAHAPASRIQAADGLRQQAASAFSLGDYTEAFRLALRGRRQLGATLETLPPSTKPSGPGGEAATASKGPIDAGAAADRVASANRCPDCGYPMLADDAFCRGCGRQNAELKCPHCGASREPMDTFCGRCGERYA